MNRTTRFFNIALLALASVFSTLPAHSAALTDFAENKFVDAFLRGQTLSAPATGYIALYTVCPTDSTAGTEVTGGSYARVAIAASLTNWAGTQAAGSTVASSGTSGTSSNNIAVSFATPTASWSTVVCWGYVDALTAGNIWFYSALTTHVVGAPERGFHWLQGEDGRHEPGRGHRHIDHKPPSTRHYDDGSSVAQ